MSCPVLEHLKQLLLQQQLPHAVLLTADNPALLTTLAMQFVSMAMCEQPLELYGSYTACGVCTGCILMGSASHPDVYQIKPQDDSGQINIEQIRAIDTFIAFAPQRALHKILYIQQLEALNTYASNAFLKVLEEPPAQVILFMTTMHTHSLMPTLLSRVTVFPVITTSTSPNNLKISENLTAFTAQLQQLATSPTYLLQLAKTWGKADTMQQRILHIHNMWHVLALLIRQQPTAATTIILLAALTKLNQLLLELAEVPGLDLQLFWEVFFLELAPHVFAFLPPAATIVA
jgi:DNA polymerase-3 subunit delta'